MKNLLDKMHKPAKTLLVAGYIIIVLMVAVSAFLYVGAGRFFDYYSVIGLSDGLLSSVRPISVFVCLGSVGAEYIAKHKETH